MAQTLSEAFVSAWPIHLGLPADEGLGFAALDDAGDAFDGFDRILREQEHDAAHYVADLAGFVARAEASVAGMELRKALAELDDVIAVSEKRADILARDGASIEKSFRRTFAGSPAAIRDKVDRFLVAHAAVVAAMLDCALGLRALRAEKAHDPATDRTFTDAAGLEGFLRSIHAA